jgi:integrase
VKTFYLTRKFRGKVERTLLGRVPELVLAQARIKAAKFQVQYDAGLNPNEVKRQAKSELTLDELFVVYHREHCLIKNKHPSQAHANYMRYLSPTLGNIQLSRIKRSDIKLIMSRLAAKGNQRTANVAHDLIRAMYNKALAWEYFDGRNPGLHIERYPTKVRTRVLLESELSDFHAALSLEPSETNKDAILMLMYSGARSGNVLAMHWSDVDLDRALWFIPETKNGEPHVAVLTKEALDILRRRRKQTSSVFVFPGSGKTGHLENLKKAWQRLLDHSGIEGLHMHDLRRTLASWMANSGANQAQIQMQLGHKDSRSAKAYVHPDVEYIRRSVGSVTHQLSNKKSQKREVK